MRAIGFMCVVFVAVLATTSARAQAPYRPYDGLQAGLDAFRLAEERRQAALANQLATNDQMRAWSGLPLSRGQTTYYGYPGYYGNPSWANLDYAYAYPAPRPWGVRTVFEPWPLVPGDIYGYTYIAPLRQPVGQWQGQTGPNRWESHPVYDPPLPPYQPQPLVESPLLDATPYANPNVAPPASSPKGREF